LTRLLINREAKAKLGTHGLAVLTLPVALVMTSKLTGQGQGRCSSHHVQGQWHIVAAAL